MRITDVKAYPVVPATGRVSDSASKVGWVFVVVETDEGVNGIGECTNWPRRGDILVAKALQVVKDSVVGRDPNSIEEIWHDLYRNYTYLGSRGIVTTLISGIDIALWDLKGKSLGRPVHDLLGGHVRDGIPLYTHPQYGTPEMTADSAKRQVAEGYEAVKTDPFWEEMGPYHTAYMSGYISKHGVRRGAEAVAAIREAVGPDVEILIDAHGNYDVASAVRCAEALEPYDITWFEEPVPPEGLDALMQVRDSVNVPICTGERFYTRWDFLPVLQNRLADYLMADVCWTGGITELRKIANLAEAYYVPISPHGAMGPIQLLAGGHVAKTIPNLYRLEIFSLWLPAFNRALKRPLDIRQGSLFLSDEPGLGVELDMDWVEANPDPAWR
jgi:galactonate dehydratase